MTGELRFEVDWESVDEAIQAVELRATWCRLAVWMGVDCLTLVEDSASTRSVRQHLSVSLYPLAEWVAFNWWSLCYDSRDDGARVRSERRNLKYAGDGFIWPNCEFVPQGESTLVRWAGGYPGGSERIRFLGAGARGVESGVVRETLADLVETVLVRLLEEGVRDTALQREWAAVRSMDPEEVEFCVGAARLGLDPYAEGVDLADEIGAVVQSIEPEVLGDFFDSVLPDSLGDSARWVNAALRDAVETDVSAAFNLGDVQRVIAETAASHARPWLAGYTAAQNLRRMLGLTSDQGFTGQFPVGAVSSSIAYPKSFVAAGRRFGDRATIAASSAGPASRRFAAARTLWHAGRIDETAPFLLTTGRTTAQSAGRAFAAELLAPAAGIREMLPGEPARAATEDIEYVAEVFGVSSMVVKHQIDNQLRSS